MNKYSQIIEKIRTTKRIYTVNVDKFILWITLISFFWILAYKLIFININPLFVDTHNISYSSAEITFSIFSSIVAASIFYFVTVFIPRCNAINNMRRNILKDLLHINGLIEPIVSVNKQRTNKKYTFEEFSILIHNKQHEAEFEIFKNDFVNHFIHEDKMEGLKVSILYLKSYIEPIYQNYSNILPWVVIELLNDYKYRNYDLSILSEDKTTIYENYLYQIVQARMITDIFKIYYDLKE